MVIKGISQEQLYELKRVQQHFEGLSGKIINAEQIGEGRVDPKFKVTISIEGAGFKQFIFRTINKYLSQDFDTAKNNTHSIMDKISNKEETTLYLRTIIGIPTCDSTMVYRDTRTNNYWIVADYIETNA